MNLNRTYRLRVNQGSYKTKFKDVLFIIIMIYLFVRLFSVTGAETMWVSGVSVRSELFHC